MVKKLRNKFVVITTTLLIALFGSFLIINTVYANYWNEIEIVEMLNWTAHSGIFISDNDQFLSKEELIRDITKDDSPITGIIMDQNGNIISSRVIGSEKNIDVPHSVIEAMYKNKNAKRKIDNYFYSYSKLSDEMSLLVVMDSRLDELNWIKNLGIILLVTIGIIILEVLIFGLSKFVTKPAELTLNREKQFISDAGHELKTPLGAISINAQVLEIEQPDNLYIKNIVSESQRMGRLLEKLLILARFDEQEKGKFIRIDVSKICEEMALTYESLAFEKKIQFDYEVDSDIKIIGNEDEIKQLLVILIDNAIKNTPINGVVILKCKEIKKHVEINISNTGAGIPKESIPHIFERFYTSDKSRSNGSFGLGLSIAKAIVERHEGSIDVESEINEMTTFRVII